MGSFSVIKKFLKEQEYKQIFYNMLGQYRPLRHTLKRKKNDSIKNHQSPFAPAHFSNIIKNEQGAKIMYDILNINEDKPTAHQTWNNLYNIIEKD